MRLLIPVAIVLILATAALVAVWLNTRARGYRRTRRDLNAHRQFVAGLRDLAYGHLELGDPFARIVADEIHLFTSRNNNKEIS